MLRKECNCRTCQPDLDARKKVHQHEAITRGTTLNSPTCKLISPSARCFSPWDEEIEAWHLQVRYDDEHASGFEYALVQPTVGSQELDHARSVRKSSLQACSLTATLRPSGWSATRDGSNRRATSEIARAVIAGAPFSRSCEGLVALAGWHIIDA